MLPILRIVSLPLPPRGIVHLLLFKFVLFLLVGIVLHGQLLLQPPRLLLLLAQNALQLQYLILELPERQLTIVATRLHLRDVLLQSGSHLGEGDSTSAS